MQKHIPIAVAGAVLVVAGGVFGATQAFAKEVTLVVDGQTQKVRTWDSQVSEVLAGKKIAVNEHDVVTPAPQESLKDKSTITVSYGRELRVTINGKEQVHWTTATNVNDALAALQLRGGENARISVSRSAPIGREGLAFSLDVPTRVTVVAGGKSQDVDAAGDVNAALAAAGVTAGADDIVTPERTTPLTGDMKIKVVKVEKKTVTEDVEVPFAVTKVDDATLEKGQTKVKVAGVNGSSKVTFDVVMHDGKVISKTKKSEAAGTEAKPQTLLVGTKAPAPAKPIDTSGSGQGSINWDKLAQCEAGGNWATNTGNGYYGGLQFSAQTWAGFGGTKYAPTANLASKAQQIEIGEKVYKSQGLGAWPGCTAKGMY